MKQPLIHKRNNMMKRILTLAFCLCFHCLLAQVPAKPGLSDSTLGKPNPQEELNKKKAEEAHRKAAQQVSNQLKEKLQARPELYPEGGVMYTHPGIVALDEGGVLQGSENVYNISDHISVGVEISVAEGVVFPVQEAVLRERVKSILQSAGITPQAEYTNDKPPLPFLNIVLIVQPINKGFAIYCAGNLFEQVDLKRVNLERGTWQAITWDNQHLLVSSTEEAPYHVNKCVDEIAYSFVKLYRYFLDVRPPRR